MAIDWKTIISEFDGKPTLLQAIGKLRKAVEDETITIQQAQAEIAKLESQQKADEALIKTAQSTADEAKINAYNASQKGDQALGKATTAGTKAQQALDLATTNETDIGTLDGQVAQIETNLNNKQDKITKTTNLSCRKIQTDSLSFTMELGSDSTEYDYGLLFSSKTMVSTGQLKPSFKDENFFEWVLPAKSGTLATTDDIRVVSSIEVTLTPADVTRGTLTDEQLATLLLNDNCYIKHNGIIYTLFKRSDTVLRYTAGYLSDTNNVQTIKVLVNSKAWTIENIALPKTKTYKHHVKIEFDNSVDYITCYIEFISSNNRNCNSLNDIKLLLGDSFHIQAYGEYTTPSTSYQITELNATDIYFINGSRQSSSIVAYSNFVITDTVTTI